MAPILSGGSLSWTSARVDASVVALPVEGGASHSVVEGAQSPTWHPNGRQLGYFYGDWRAADWALNWDGGAVQVDSAIRPIAPPGPLIIGYHEDFSPVWSPNGQWIAYHSHRSSRPVVSYAESGSTDDIYLRAAGASSERRDSTHRLRPRGRVAGLVTRRHAPRVHVVRPRARDSAILSVHDHAGHRVGARDVERAPRRFRPRSPAPRWSPGLQRATRSRSRRRWETGRHALWVVRTDGTSAAKARGLPNADVRWRRLDA